MSSSKEVTGPTSLIKHTKATSSFLITGILPVVFDVDDQRG
jgi:hypothetical protein